MIATLAKQRLCSTTLDLLHTCVCAGSHRVCVCLSGLINGRNQFNSWGFPQVPHSSPGLCRTVETIGFECGLKPLGANNIGNGSKSCSHSTRKQHQLFTRPSNSASLFIRPSGSTSCSSDRVTVQACSSDRVAALAVHQTERRQQAARAVLLRRHQRQLSDFSRFSSAPNPPRGFASLKLGSG
jgi:hypothetical protein